MNILLRKFNYVNNIIEVGLFMISLEVVIF